MAKLSNECPCCGATLQDQGLHWLPDQRTLLKDDLALRILGKYELRMFDALWKARVQGRGLTKEHLMTACYFDDPNDGPNDMQIINVRTSWLNKRLRKLGLEIKSDLGQGASFYRLRDIRDV